MLFLACPLPGAAAAAVSLDAFRARHGPEWSLQHDRRTGLPRRLAGGAIPLLDPSLLAETDRAEADPILLDRLLAFLEQNATLLELSADVLDALRPADPGVLHAASGRLRVLHLEHAPGGVPVSGDRITMAVSHGNLIYLHRVGMTAVTASPVPRVPAPMALARARQATEARFGPSIPRDRPELWFQQEATVHRLVWRVAFEGADDHRLRVAEVDAASGEVLSVRDETVEACSAPPVPSSWKRVVGGVRAERADEPERIELLPFVSVGGAVAGEDGLFLPAAARDEASLTGPEVEIACAGCAAPGDPRAATAPGGGIDFGFGGTNEIGNGTSTPADRSVYLNVVQARVWARRWLDLPWLQSPLLARTNIDSSCNAFFNGSSINFFRSSSLCGNTGEIRDVVLHEWGHGLDYNDGIRSSPLDVDAATGEAVGDILALLRSRDACVGESFYRDPARFPSPDCSGVRDLDERSPGHEHGTISTANVGSICRSRPGYQGPLGGEGHCEGEIFGQAWWHLVRNLLDGFSYADGSPLPGGPLPAEQAWQTAELLFFASRPLMVSYAPSRMQSLGTSAWDALLVADDEGDGIANGTPHAAAIADALTHHGMEEGPAPPDTSGCSAPPDPVVSVVTAHDDEAGLPALEITWNDTGAASYVVLRASDRDDAFLPVGVEHGPGPGRFLDRGIFPSRTYHYRVVGTDAGGCSSSGTVVSGSASGPVLEIVDMRLDDSVGGNGDGLLEEGERARVFLDLANRGNGGATDLQATISSSNPLLAVTDAGPVAYGNVAAGATVAAPGAFSIRADAGVPRRLTLTLSADAAEGCLRAARGLELAMVELAWAGRSVGELAGDGDGAWEPGETAELEARLVNQGLLTAQDVRGVLTFRGPPPTGIAITNDTATWPDIPGRGGPSASLSPHFTLSADPGLGPRTKVFLSLEITVGGDFHAVFDLDATVGGMAPPLYEWGTSDYAQTTPLVIQLTDDDADGVIGRCDTPDIVYVRRLTDGSEETRLVAVSGDGTGEHWVLADPCVPVSQNAGLVAGDIDGDGRNEIVMAGPDGFVCAVSSEGAVIWRSEEPAEADQSSDPRWWTSPQLWDLEGDGEVEVVLGSTVLRGRDGTLVWQRRVRNYGRNLVADLDLDGHLEILSAGQVWSSDGAGGTALFPDFGWNGVVVQMDDDPLPELAYGSNDTFRARNHDGSLLWEVTEDPPFGFANLPPPCAGDLDGDGLAEVVLPEIGDLIAFDHDGTELWRAVDIDTSGMSSGCALFDFDRDGLPEVVQRGFQALYILDGRDGEILATGEARSISNWENAVIADVDADGSAEIVVTLTQLASGDPQALRVYGNPAWPAARGVWNHDSYSVVNVEEDGQIPTKPFPSWLGRNDFRGQEVICPCSGPRPEVLASVPDCSPEDPDGDPAARTVCFDVEVLGGRPPLELTWEFGDGSPSESAEDPCHTYASAGTYTATLRVEDWNGCVAETRRLVRFGEPLLVAFTAGEACTDRPVCFTADSTGGAAPLEHFWDLAGIPAAGGSACREFSAGGAYEIVLSARDANGCSAEYRETVDVLGPATLPEVSPSGSATPLRVRKEDDMLRISWEDVGRPVSVYSGSFADLAGVGYRHQAMGACSVPDSTVLVPSPQGARVYFLAAATACDDPAVEGPYGSDSGGRQRPDAAALGLPRCP